MPQHYHYQSTMPSAPHAPPSRNNSSSSEDELLLREGGASLGGGSCSSSALPLSSAAEGIFSKAVQEPPRPRKTLQSNKFWPGMHIICARSDTHPGLQQVRLETGDGNWPKERSFGASAEDWVTQSSKIKDCEWLARGLPKNLSETRPAQFEKALETYPDINIDPEDGGLILVNKSRNKVCVNVTLTPPPDGGSSSPPDELLCFDKRVGQMKKLEKSIDKADRAAREKCDRGGSSMENGTSSSSGSSSAGASSAAAESIIKASKKSRRKKPKFTSEDIQEWCLMSAPAKTIGYEESRSDVDEEPEVLYEESRTGVVPGYPSGGFPAGKAAGYIPAMVSSIPKIPRIVNPQKDGGTTSSCSTSAGTTNSSLLLFRKSALPAILEETSTSIGSPVSLDGLDATTTVASSTSSPLPATLVGEVDGHTSSTTTSSTPQGFVAIPPTPGPDTTVMLTTTSAGRLALMMGGDGPDAGQLYHATPQHEKGPEMELAPGEEIGEVSGARSAPACMRECDYKYHGHCVTLVAFLKPFSVVELGFVDDPANPPAIEDDWVEMKAVEYGPCDFIVDFDEFPLSSWDDIVNCQGAKPVIGGGVGKAPEPRSNGNNNQETTTEDHVGTGGRTGTSRTDWLCSQGWGGPLTHCINPHTYYAYDFDAAIGTPLIALCDGVVDSVRTGWRTHGPHLSNFYFHNEIRIAVKRAEIEKRMRPLTEVKLVCGPSRIGSWTCWGSETGEGAGGAGLGLFDEPSATQKRRLRQKKAKEARKRAKLVLDQGDRREEPPKEARKEGGTCTVGAEQGAPAAATGVVRAPTSQNGGSEGAPSKKRGPEESSSPAKIAKNDVDQNPQRRQNDHLYPIAPAPLSGGFESISAAHQEVKRIAAMDTSTTDEHLFLEYVHIDAAVVRPGDVVRQGQLLGYSGRAGFTPTQHLHIQLTKPVVNGSANHPLVQRNVLPPIGSPNSIGPEEISLPFTLRGRQCVMGERYS